MRAFLAGTVRLRLRGAPRRTAAQASVRDPAAPGGMELDATVCGDRTVNVNVAVDVVATRNGRFVLEALGWRAHSVP